MYNATYIVVCFRVCSIHVVVLIALVVVVSCLRIDSLSAVLLTPEEDSMKTVVTLRE